MSFNDSNAARSPSESGPSLAIVALFLSLLNAEGVHSAAGDLVVIVNGPPSHSVRNHAGGPRYLIERKGRLQSLEKQGTEMIPGKLLFGTRGCGSHDLNPRKALIAVDAVTYLA